MKKCSEISESISLYIDGELGTEENREFMEHIDSCPSCRKELDEIMQIIGLCSDIVEEELPESFKSELHSKLLQVGETDSGRLKAAVNRSRYIRVFSSVAAGLLLIFLVRGFFNYGAFFPSKTAENRAGMSMKAAQAPEMAADMQAEAPAAEENTMMEFSDGAGETGNYGDQALKLESDRSATNKDRENQSPKLAASFAEELVSNRVASLVIIVEKPDSEIQNLKDIALQNSGEEKNKETADSYKGTALKSTDPDIAAELSFLIPNIQYDAFNAAIASYYGKENIQPGTVVTEDMADVIGGLIARSDYLGEEIKAFEEKKDTDDDQDEIDKIKAEKEQTDAEIEKIRLAADFTEVTIVLKKK